MKDKFIMFIVGLLTGAIIATSAVYFYTIANNKQGMQLPHEKEFDEKNQPPEMPNGASN